jgi:hypothetical protein
MTLETIRVVFGIIAVGLVAGLFHGGRAMPHEGAETGTGRDDRRMPS